MTTQEEFQSEIDGDFRKPFWGICPMCGQRRKLVELSEIEQDLLYAEHEYTIGSMCITECYPSFFP